MPAHTLESLLRTTFPDAHITLKDTAGDQDHYELTVVCEQFRGKSRIAQHQMVYAALQGNMGGKLHALALKTAVPA